LVPLTATLGVIITLQTLVSLALFQRFEFLVYDCCLVVVLLLAVLQFARLILARAGSRWPEFCASTMLVAKARFRIM
jgi:hypothetical protein